jgi:threonine dehydrogenase-like Zn-dependent dehydrogenase
MGSFKDDLISFPVNGIKNREQTFIGSMGHPETYGPVIDLVADGRLELAGLISHTVGLDGLADAFQALDEKRDGVVKIAVEP